VTSGRIRPAGRLHSWLLRVFLVGADPWRVDAGSRFGEADRMRRDRRERPRRGGRERDNGTAKEDGAVQCWLPGRVTPVDQQAG
jgi:hypothetical protein